MSAKPKLNRKADKRLIVLNPLYCIKSAHFVPGYQPERIAKALAIQASVVIIDLEDAVTLDEKIQARQITQEKSWKNIGQTADRSSEYPGVRFL